MDMDFILNVDLQEKKISSVAAFFLNQLVSLIIIVMTRLPRFK